MTMPNNVTNVQLYSEHSNYVAIARDNGQARTYSRSSIKSRTRLIHVLKELEYQFTPFHDGWGAFRPH